MDTVEEQRRHFNVRLGRQTTSWPLLINRDTDTLSDNAKTTPTDQQQAIRTFLQQKPHRVHQSVLLRKIIYMALTTSAFILAWLIGYYQYSTILLGIVLIAMFLIWKEQSKKIELATQQEIEMKVRRRKAMQLSETAEWVNLALNRWWMTCNESVFGFVKDYIEPLLQEIIPIGIDSLELTEFDFANQTPFLKNIQIFDPPPQNTPGNEFQSPSTSSTKSVIVANMDIGLVAPDSKLVFKARIGGKKMGYNTLVYVEGLHLSGSLQAIIHIDYSAPFPHIGCISATFTRKPDLWYSVRVLKGLKVTDIPLVKSIVHSFIMSIFQSLLVDPGRLEIDLMSSGPQSIADPKTSRRARGVITITFSGNPPETKSKYEDDPRRWVTFRLSNQKYQLQLPTGRQHWKTTHSFLVYDLKEDEMIIKVKHRRIMYTMTLAVHNITMTSLGVVSEEGEELQGNKFLSLSNSETNFSMDIDYTHLLPFSLNYLSLPTPKQVAGVLYVHVHSATGLRSGDVDGLSDPYCVVLVNKKKVLATHYILDTLEPKWERGVEFFVHDFTQVSLTFVVYDWDGPLVGDDFLGSCKMNLEWDKPYILQKQLDLEIGGSSVYNGQSLGQVTVSVVFRDVESVSRSELSDATTTTSVSNTDLTQSSTLTKNTSKQNWKKLKGLGALLPGENFGIIELSIIRGRDLVAMDRNGFSDPYIVVKYGTCEMYRTPFVNRTLNPNWNCHCTLSAPAPTSSIVIECWDHDQFSNDDFMGSIAFSSDELHIFENGPRWCKLLHAANGEIFIELRKTEASQDSLSSGDISHLDEASKHLLERNPDSQSISSSIVDSEGQEPPDVRGLEQTKPFIVATQDSNESSPVRSSSPMYHSASNLANSTLSVPGGNSVIRRRNTVNVPSRPKSVTPSMGSGDSSLSNQSLLISTIGTTDAENEFRARQHRRNDPMLSAEMRGLFLETPVTHPGFTAFYHNLSGEIIEAEGLKGKLDHLELYIKIRLNSHPSHLRSQKFDRGNVVHRSRRLRGSSSLRYKEPFVVKETPVPSDSLLTIDLKSGPRVTLGTHVITLDKFFEGNLKATKWLDLGNDMRIMIQLSRQRPHVRSMDTGIADRR